jgi:hypothetical protein
MFRTFWLRKRTFKLHLGVGHSCEDDFYNVSLENYGNNKNLTALCPVAGL